MEPRDLTIDAALRGINPQSGLGISSHHAHGANVGFADASARFVDDKVPVTTLQLLLDRNDGHVIPDY